MKIYYDGLNIEKYSKNPLVEGFTTNCSFFSQNDIKSYQEFYNINKSFIQDRSISFQTWENDILGIKQIDKIHNIDKNIFVKIPIINSINEINYDLIQYTTSNQIPINITAIYTYEQINEAYEFLKDTNVNAIVSIFAGPISDSGLDPSPFILYP